MVRKKRNRTETPELPAGAQPPVVEGDQGEMAEKAEEIRTTYGKGVKNALAAGRLLSEYQAKLANRNRFNTFWKDHLHWPKTRVYRLIDAQRYFGHLPEAILGMFDLSALYALSGEGVKEAARTKAIKKAESGEFVTNAVANKLLGRGAKTTSSTPGKITIAMKKLTAEAKKLNLDAGKVIELLEHLGVTVEFTDGKPKKVA